GHGDARGLDLPVRHPAALHGLQAELAECDRRPAPSLAGHAPALLFPILDLLWHHHGGLPSILVLVAFRLGLPFGPGRRRLARLLLPRRLLRRHQRRQDRRARARSRTWQVGRRSLYRRPGLAHRNGRRSGRTTIAALPAISAVSTIPARPTVAIAAIPAL